MSQRTPSAVARPREDLVATGIKREQDRGRERREKLVEAGLNTCACTGLGGLSLQAVADTAGVAKSVVLYYFRDRDGLLDALAARAVLPWLVAHEALAVNDAPSPHTGADPAGDPREVLNRWLAAMFHLAVRERQALRLRLALQAEQPTASWRAHQDGCDRLALRLLALLLQRGHAQYAWHAPDAGRAALLVRGLVDGLCLEALRTEDLEAATRLHGLCRGAVLDLLVRR